jgi:hypothetical protein
MRYWLYDVKSSSPSTTCSRRRVDETIAYRSISDVDIAADNAAVAAGWSMRNLLLLLLLLLQMAIALLLLLLKKPAAMEARWS